MALRIADDEDRGRATVRSLEGCIAGRSRRRADFHNGVAFGEVADRYDERHIGEPTRKASAQEKLRRELASVRAIEITRAGQTLKLEQMPLPDVNAADIEDWRQRERARYAAEGRRSGEVALNRRLALLRALFNWAIRSGLTDHTPFKRGGIVVLTLNHKAERPRTRRLLVGEEDALLRHAQPHLRGVIVALLDTGVRIGELLALRWADVRLDRDELTVPAAIAKSGLSRTVPISQRLRAILELRRLDPEGQELPASAFVFGNEVGERIASVKKAWGTCCGRRTSGTPRARFAAGGGQPVRGGPRRQRP